MCVCVRAPACVRAQRAWLGLRWHKKPDQVKSEHMELFVTVTALACASLRICVREGERVSGSTCVNPQGDNGSVCLWLTLSPRSPQTDGLIKSLSRPLADNGSLIPLSRPGSQSEKQHGSQESHTLRSVCCSAGIVKEGCVQDKPGLFYLCFFLLLFFFNTIYGPLW